jgi:hypothetical protein
MLLAPFITLVTNNGVSAYMLLTKTTVRTMHTSAIVQLDALQKHVQHDEFIARVDLPDCHVTSSFVL